MIELWTKQAVLSYLTLKCNNGLGPNHTFLVHSIRAFASSYIKFLQLMELWTGQIVSSHLTLDLATHFLFTAYDLMMVCFYFKLYLMIVLSHLIRPLIYPDSFGTLRVHNGNTYAYQVSSHSTLNDKVMLRTNPLPAIGDHIIRPVPSLTGL